MTVRSYLQLYSSNYNFRLNDILRWEMSGVGDFDLLLDFLNFVLSNGRVGMPLFP